MLVFAQEGPDLVGSLRALTAEDWIAAGFVLAGTIVVARLVRSLIVRAGVQRDARGHALEILARFVSYAVFVGGLFFAMSALGVDLGPLLGLLGIFGLAIALAVQDIFSNFIAGLILLLRRPFKAGDEVSIAGHDGLVEDVNLRETIIRGPDGVATFVPNGAVLSNPIINNTNRPIRRTTLAVGLAYDTDLATAAQLLVETVAAIPQVASDVKPTAFVHEFGESAITFAVTFWHASDVAGEWAVRHDVAVAVHRALASAGIEIPYPHRVIETTN